MMIARWVNACGKFPSAEPGLEHVRVRQIPPVVGDGAVQLTGLRPTAVGFQQAAEHARTVERGMQNQSMEPSRSISATEWRSPPIP